MEVLGLNFKMLSLCKSLPFVSCQCHHNILLSPLAALGLYSPTKPYSSEASKDKWYSAS